MALNRNIDDPGARLAATMAMSASLSFVPIAVHFDLLPLLAEIGPVATAEALTDACNARRTPQEQATSPLCRDTPVNFEADLLLLEDTMLAMANLQICDLVDSNTFRANAVTEQIHAVPSASHGMLHFTTEPLFAGAFLMLYLKATNFSYPFKENETPFQYGYKMIGRPDLAQENFYNILHLQGRLPSFNTFMEGKFGHFGTMPDRLKHLGYDLEVIAQSQESPVVMVDIGGGQGEMLLEVQAAFPHLGANSLVVQEHNPDILKTAEITFMDWDYKGTTPQPVNGAVAYSLTHILHNVSDLEALRLLEKIASAMAPYSRLLIHEFSKNAYNGMYHAAMILMLGGRERSSAEWHLMADLAGLKVTFEAYPPLGEGLVEMMKDVA